MDPVEKVALPSPSRGRRLAASFCGLLGLLVAAAGAAFDFQRIPLVVLGGVLLLIALGLRRLSRQSSIPSGLSERQKVLLGLKAGNPSALPAPPSPSPPTSSSPSSGPGLVRRRPSPFHSSASSLASPSVVSPRPFAGYGADAHAPSFGSPGLVSPPLAKPALLAVSPATTAVLSPSPLRARVLDPQAILDEASLSAFLSERERAAMPVSPRRDGLGMLDHSFLGSSETAVPSYAASIRETVAAPVTKGGRLGLEDESMDLANAEAAQRLYAELQIERQIERWETRMRKWIAVVVVGPVARAFEQSDRCFEVMTAEVLKTQAEVLARGEAELLRSNKKTAIIGFLMNRYPTHAYSERRRALLRYITVGDAASTAAATAATALRSYVLQRVKELASEGDQLEGYRWDGGSEARHHAGLPPDAVVIMHLFCTLMDEASGVSFTRRHFRDLASASSSTAPPDSKAPLTIVQNRPAGQPPYYLLSHSQGVWRPEPGRSNLFHTLALFVLGAKRFLKGRIGALSLASSDLGGLGGIIGD